jgi:membrane protein insertase Oxa1/YidC/SpoIIIJ
MKYLLPVFIVVAAYTLSAAIALYWITNNVFTTVHELVVRRNKGEKGEKTEEKASSSEKKTEEDKNEDKANKKKKP